MTQKPKSKSSLYDSLPMREARFKQFCNMLYKMLFLSVTTNGQRRDDAYINHIVVLMENPNTKFHSKATTETIAKTYGILDAQLVKELTEYAIILAAKKVLYTNNKTVENKYWEIVSLYENQPYSTYRSSSTQALQQYSTPIPLAFLMDEFVKGGEVLVEVPKVKSAKKVSIGQGYKMFKDISTGSSQDYEVTFADGHTEKEADRGMGKEYAIDKAIQSYTSTLKRKAADSTKTYLEPTAGNGMLIFDLPAAECTVNELDLSRLGMLHKQGFKLVLNLDASKPLGLPLRSFDGIITNPPFGKTDTDMVFYGWKLHGLEAQIVAAALEYMKDGGRAAIIIGGHTEFTNDGRIKSEKDYRFLNYLAHFYNLVDVINIEGDLYFKQGTRTPIRMILIDGRKAPPNGYMSTENQNSDAATPFSIEVVNTWKILWQRVGLP